MIIFFHVFLSNVLKFYDNYDYVICISNFCKSTSSDVTQVNIKRFRYHVIRKYIASRWNGLPLITYFTRNIIDNFKLISGTWLN